ncbi:MAG: HK97 family phage prohead protease [Faecalibacterium sp.]|nr:HK97 family phage prohead protease [Ruminococcus sp.]MCM1392098.1 HK97 family phage prohead protease [Ruminococcus sp.]MCM1485795.1 HK97 family phage prohead protease [Faecalibacterium sp.]
MAMKIQLRNDSVHISGYVNAVDRFSRPIRDSNGQFFIEKIAPGTFQRAIDEGEDIGVMLNHERTITSVRGGNITLREDNIGLFFDGDITDKEIIDKAKHKQLVGWSFGFIPIAPLDTQSRCAGVAYERTVDSLKLIEVSIIDSTKKPCYVGTSIEARGEDKDKEMCLRAEDLLCDYFDEQEQADTDKAKQQLLLRKRKLQLAKYC